MSLTESLSAQLRSSITTHAERGLTALVMPGGQKISYGWLGRAIDRSAAAARQAGVRRGELVGVAAAKSARSVATFFGIMQAGGCPCFLEPRLEQHDLRARLDSVGMTRLVADETNAEVTARLEAEVAVHTLAAFTADVDQVETLVGGDDRAMMLFTSGSTGRPKGVLLSHANLLANARGITSHTRLTSDDRLLHVMPLHHTNGINNQLIAPLLAGATIVLLPRFQAHETVQAIREHTPTYVTGVPTMYTRMTPYVGKNEQFPSLRFLRCGSAPITPTQHREIEHAFGVPLILSYGLSEATCTTTMNPPGATRVGSVGTILASQQVRIFRPGTTDDVAAGVEGEVCIAGPTLMLGYLGTDDMGPIRDSWLRTGDLGRLDGDGYLTISGRLKDVIIRGGENISPATIEHAMVHHPAIRDCCVIGMPHDDLGEVPVAFVTTMQVAKPPSTDELKNFIRNRLSRIHLPHDISVLPDLPTNSVGKVDRAALRRLVC